MVACYFETLTDLLKSRQGKMRVFKSESLQHKTCDMKYSTLLQVGPKFGLLSLQKTNYTS
jgi:hypothetical protein